MSILERSKIEEENRRLDEEIKKYRKLIDRAKVTSELTEESKMRSKAIALSDLPSPKSISQLSKENLEIKCKMCAGLILEYGRKVL